MMPETNDIVISYNGNTIATTSASGQKTIGTSGKFCTGNIIVDYTKPTSDVSWFGGIDSVKIYELTKEFALTDFTNWNEFVPSTTAFALKFPATTYSTTSSTSVTFDRVGKNGSTIYNNIILDFSQYNYTVITDVFCTINYTDDESSLGISHVISNSITNIIQLGQVPRVLDNEIVMPTNNTSGQTTYASSINSQASIFRSQSNLLSYVRTAYYGVRLGTPSANLAGSAYSFDDTYININSGTLSVLADTYMSANAWNYVSARDTKFKYRARLYQVKKPNTLEYSATRQAESMLINGVFPVD